MEEPCWSDLSKELGLLRLLLEKMLRSERLPPPPPPPTLFFFVLKIRDDGLDGGRPEDAPRLLSPLLFPDVV